MTVNTISAAWEIADSIFPTDYIKSEKRSLRAGYDIYGSTEAGNDSYICDLGNRLEINLETGKSINIWIEPAKAPEKPKTKKEKEIELESITTIVDGNTTAQIRKASVLTLSETTALSEIGRFEKEAQRIINEARKAAKYGACVRISLSTGVYEFTTADDMRQVSFNLWSGSGLEITADGVHLSPDLRYNSDECKDFWLTGCRGQLWGELTI